MTNLMEKFTRYLGDNGGAIKMFLNNRDGYPQIGALRGSEFLLTKARSYLMRHPELLNEIAAQGNISLATPKRPDWSFVEEMGLVQNSEEAEEYGKVIFPLKEDDLLVRDFWLERMAMRFSENLPDDFHSVYNICMRE